MLHRVRPEQLLGGGMLVLAASCGLFLAVSDDSSVVVLLAALAVSGIGQAVVFNVSNIEAVGSVASGGGEAAIPAAAYAGDGKRFVCICEDVTVKDVKRAIAEGFDSIELSKRYTTVTMGPCQGRFCHLNSIRLYARESRMDERTVGTTTARPPWSPVSRRGRAGDRRPGAGGGWGCVGGQRAGCGARG